MSQPFKPAAKPSLSRDRKGAALGEYGILVGFLSAVAIGSVALVGVRVETTFQSASDSIEEADAGTTTAPQVPEVLFEIPAGQSFLIMPYAEPGDRIGTVRTSGGEAQSFSLLTGGEGFTIDNAGVLTIADTMQMPAAGSTRQAGVEATATDGATSDGSITLDRSRTGDAPSDTDTWAELAIDGITRSEFDTGDTNDWFRFTAPASGFQLHVVVEGYTHHGWTEITNPDFRLLDASGTEIRRYARAGTDYTLFEWLNPGEYFLDVSAAEEGGYRVSAYEVVDIPTSRGKSADGTFGVMGESTLLTGDPGDTWHYVLDMPRSVTIEVASKDLGTGTGALPNPDFRVLDANGEEISRHSATGPTETATTGTLPTGDFYVQVITTDPSQDGGYSIIVNH
jgi:Flp pilus assembly pilin Flp